MRVRWSDLSIAARLLACGAMSLVLAPCVAAQTQPPSSVEASSEIRILFDIPAGPLDSALRRYSILTGRQLLFESRLVAGYHAAALRGLATADEALDELLAETGLQVDSVDARTGVLSVTALDSMPAAPSATPPSADNRVLETRSVGWLTLARTEASAVPAEVIVVTGSRFARSDLTAVTPVFVLGLMKWAPCWPHNRRRLWSFQASPRI